MARVKNPLFSESASGDLGGLLYRPGTYGNVVSRRSVTPSLQTPAQTRKRAMFHAASLAWSALPDVTKAAWHAFAIPPMDGRSSFISGFCTLRTYSQIATPSPRHGPVVNFVTVLNAYKVGTSGRQFSITWSYSGAAGNRILIYWLGTWSKRTFPKPAKLKYNGYGTLSSGGSTFYVPYGAPRNWFRLNLVDTLSGRVLQEILVKVDQ